MIFRTLVLTAGVACGLCAAQFPAFSQQYLQRLGGAVDALEEVVRDFDDSAAKLGLSRDAALMQMQGTPFVDARRIDMQRTFQRYDTLSADFAALIGLGPFMRAYHAGRLTDRDIARGAWAAFQPALPLTLSSLLFAGMGFLMGSLLAAFAWRLARFGVRRTPMPA